MKKCVLFYLLLIFAMSIFAQNTGGPDTFGYTYINSLEPTGPTFSWITPSTTNEVTGLSDDSFVGSFPIGFNFSFYDSVYDQIFVGSNGLIGFDSASMNTLSNSPIPTAGIPNSQIFWCWDDLNPTYTWANSAIYYENTTVDQMNAFVMSFISYSEYGGSTAPDDCIDVQIILFANGDIKIQYQNIGTGFDLTNCTVGIENEDGLDGLQYLFNNTGAPLQNDLVISFMRPVAYPDDLRAMSINGNMTPTSGTNSSYTVSVLNRGSNDADNYSVKLMQFVDGVNDIELTSATGTLMSPNTTEDYIFNYTFNTVSEFQVYGYVDYAADLAPVDNSTSLFDVSVQPVGTAICTIGDESVLNNMVPFNFYYQSSLTQTMLYPDEITVGGLIMGIDFHVNWQSELINQNMNIWIGESVLADLSGGFIPASDLTPAFASTFSLTNGDYYVHLDFDTPYAYNGGNLVLMYQRPLGTQMNSSSDRWYCSTSAYPNRTIELHDNTTEYDPNLAQVGNVLDLVPNIRLYFVTSGLGALEGVATDNGAPLANVDIVVQGTNYQTMTDGNGFYAFPYLPANDYVIEANIHGYYESTINITITEDVITTGDIAMITLPVCSVSGQVIASGTMTGIPGTCYLNGYDYYEVDTDANGFFTFTGVYCDQTYQLTLNSLGYSTSSQDVVVNTADVDLGQIVLQEIAFAVNGVIAEELDTDEALLTWSPPVSSGTGGAWVYKDNGVNSDGIGLTDGGTFEVATKYEVNELSIYAGFYLNSMRFFLQSPATSVVLKIYSGNNGDVLLHEQAVPTYNDSDWNEVQLTTSIPITGQTPLWFGYEVSHTPADRPAGCDAGPHQPGGDMIKTTTVWEELHIVASTLDYNWNLQAYISQVPAARGDIYPIRVVESYNNPNVLLARETNINPIETRTITDRSLVDYTVYRFLNGNEDDTTLWTELATVADTTYTDAGWMGLPANVYKFAVVANYTNDVHSFPTYSNWLAKSMFGSLTIDLTTNVGDIPAGATIGMYALTPNPDGEYPSYQGMANDQGVSIIPHIWYGDYRVVANLTGFQGTTINSYTIDGNNQVDMMITEIVIPAHDVVAELDDFNTHVNVHWGEPGASNAPQWMAWDSGENGNGVGTGAAAQFDIACRWEPEQLDSFGGMFITQVKFFPRELACTYTVRVWSGVNAGTLLTEQLCENIVSVNNWHTEILNNPVQVDPSQELWIGVSLDTQTGHPAGCDNGPAIDSYGNMMLWEGTWQTLLAIAPTLDYNWNVQGWVDWETGGREPIQLGAPFVPNTTTFLDNSLLTTGFEDNYIVPDTREALGYNLYRLLVGTEDDPLSWALIDVMTEDTLFVDNNWPGLPSGDYRYAVKVGYTGGIESPPSLSNVVHKDQRGYLEGFITDINSNMPINEAVISADTLQIVTDETGYYIISLDEGLHNVHIEANMYLPFEMADVPVLGESVTLLNLELTPRAIVVGDDFESYDDFVLEFGYWTLVDNDSDGTSLFANVEYENEGAEMAFMVFNPTATVPPLPFADAHSGIKFIASFAASPGANDDWIITPALELGENGGILSFWARSYTDQYGLEEFNVGVSLESEGTDNFTLLNGEEPVMVPTGWTYYTYELNAYVDDVIRVGLQCVSDGCFAFFVDDLSIDSVGGTVASEQDIQLPVVTTLHGNYPNPFNPETKISFDLSKQSKVTLDIYNVKGQKVKTLTNDTFMAGSHSLVWKGRTDKGVNCGSGVYFYRLRTESQTFTKKMILLK